MRKIKRHDFSFGRYFHPEKSPVGSPKPTRSVLVYDSYRNVDRSGRRIPARKYLMGCRPER